MDNTQSRSGHFEAESTAGADRTSVGLADRAQAAQQVQKEAMPRSQWQSLRMQAQARPGHLRPSRPYEGYHNAVAALERQHSAQSAETVFTNSDANNIKSEASSAQPAVSAAPSVKAASTAAPAWPSVSVSVHDAATAVQEGTVQGANESGDSGAEGDSSTVDSEQDLESARSGLISETCNPAEQAAASAAQDIKTEEPVTAPSVINAEASDAGEPVKEQVICEAVSSDSTDAALESDECESASSRLDEQYNETAASEAQAPESVEPAEQTAVSEVETSETAEPEEEPAACDAVCPETEESDELSAASEAVAPESVEPAEQTAASEVETSETAEPEEEPAACDAVCPETEESAEVSPACEAVAPESVEPAEQTAAIEVETPETVEPVEEPAASDAACPETEESDELSAASEAVAPESVEPDEQTAASEVETSETVEPVEEPAACDAACPETEESAEVSAVSEAEAPESIEPAGQTPASEDETPETVEPVEKPAACDAACPETEESAEVSDASEVLAPESVEPSEQTAASEVETSETAEPEEEPAACDAACQEKEESDELSAASEALAPESVEPAEETAASEVETTETAEPEEEPAACDAVCPETEESAEVSAVSEAVAPESVEPAEQTAASEVTTSETRQEEPAACDAVCPEKEESAEESAACEAVAPELVEAVEEQAICEAVSSDSTEAALESDACESACSNTLEQLEESADSKAEASVMAETVAESSDSDDDSSESVESVENPSFSEEESSQSVEMAADADGCDTQCSESDNSTEDSSEEDNHSVSVYSYAGDLQSDALTPWGHGSVISDAQDSSSEGLSRLDEPQKDEIEPLCGCSSEYAEAEHEAERLDAQEAGSSDVDEGSECSMSVEHVEEPAACLAESAEAVQSDEEPAEREAQSAEAVQSDEEPAEREAQSAEVVPSAEEPAEFEAQSAEVVPSAEEPAVCEAESAEAMQSAEETAECEAQSAEAVQSAEEPAACPAESAEVVPSAEEPAECEAQSAEAVPSAEEPDECKAESAEAVPSAEEPAVCKAESAEAVPSAEEPAECEVQSAEAVQSAEEPAECEAQSADAVQSAEEPAACPAESAEAVPSAEGPTDADVADEGDGRAAAEEDKGTDFISEAVAVEAVAGCDDADGSDGSKYSESSIRADLEGSFDPYTAHSREEYERVIARARAIAHERHDQIEESEHAQRMAQQERDNNSAMMENARALAEIAMKEGLGSLLFAKGSGSHTESSNSISTQGSGAGVAVSGPEMTMVAPGMLGPAAAAAAGYHGSTAMGRRPFAYFKTTSRSNMPRDRVFLGFGARANMDVDIYSGAAGIQPHTAGTLVPGVSSDTHSSSAGGEHVDTVSVEDFKLHDRGDEISVGQPKSAYDESFGSQDTAEHNNKALDPGLLDSHESIGRLGKVSNVRSDLENDINESEIRHEDPEYWTSTVVEAHEESTLPASAFACDGPLDDMPTASPAGHIIPVNPQEEAGYIPEPEPACDGQSSDGAVADGASASSGVSGAQGASGAASGANRAASVSSAWVVSPTGGMASGLADDESRQNYVIQGHERTIAQPQGLPDQAGAACPLAPPAGVGVSAADSCGDAPHDFFAPGMPHTGHRSDNANYRGGYMPCYFLYDNGEDRYLLDEGSCRLIGITYTGDWVPSSFINNQLALIDEEELFSVFFSPSEGNNVFSHVRIKQGPHQGECLYISGSVVQRDDTGIAMLVSGYFTQIKSNFMECMCRFMNHSASFDIDTFTGEVHFGPAFHIMLGLDENEAMPATISEYEENFIHPEDLVVYRRQSDIIYNPRMGDYYESIYRIKHRGGYYIWCIDRGLVIERRRSGKASRIIGTTTNIDVVRSNFERLKRSIYQDPLTGLHNRLYLNSRYKYFTMEESQPLSLVYVDISGLKVINDYLGHAKGDELVKLSAQILTTDVYLDHEVVRLSGDEFLLIFTNCSDVQCKIFINKFACALDERNRNHEFPLPIYFGFGIATLNEIDDGDTFLRCEARADVRLQEYKTVHRERIYTALRAFIEAALGHPVDLTDNRRLEYLEKDKEDQPDVVPEFQLDAREREARGLEPLPEMENSSPAPAPAPSPYSEVLRRFKGSFAGSRWQSPRYQIGRALTELRSPEEQKLEDERLTQNGSTDNNLGMSSISDMRASSKVHDQSGSGSARRITPATIDFSSVSQLAVSSTRGMSRELAMDDDFVSSVMRLQVQGCPLLNRNEPAEVKARNHSSDVVKAANMMQYSERPDAQASAEVFMAATDGRAPAATADAAASAAATAATDAAADSSIQPQPYEVSDAGASAAADAAAGAGAAADAVQNGLHSEYDVHCAAQGATAAEATAAAAGGADPQDLLVADGSWAVQSQEISSVSTKDFPSDLIDGNCVAMSYEGSQAAGSFDSNDLYHRRMIMEAEQAAMDDMKYAANSVTVPEDLSAGFEAVDAKDPDVQSHVLNHAHDAGHDLVRPEHLQSEEVDRSSAQSVLQSTDTRGALEAAQALLSNLHEVEPQDN